MFNVFHIIGFEIVKGRKNMFYLMMDSTHYYLWLCSVRHMIKDHRLKQARLKKRMLFNKTKQYTHFR